MTFAARDFLPRRGASDEHIPSRRVGIRSEPRSLGEKALPPSGLRPLWPVASLLVGYSPRAGDAPSSRLATGQIGRNERHRIYASDHLAASVLRSRHRRGEAQSLLRSAVSHRKFSVAVRNAAG